METKELINYLAKLCKEVSIGMYSNDNKLFELTKESASYPKEIKELAESFCTMLVKLEAKDFHISQLIENLIEKQKEIEFIKNKLAFENIDLKKLVGKQFSPKKIIGQSKQITDLLAQVERIANTHVNVLITGESGTGKELIAKALHYNSYRSNEPFIAINCSAIPDTLFESELFGIEKGIASGVNQRIGLIEQAHGGTLFLDEINNMSLNNQAKILRVLEERELIRVGGNKNIPIDIRLIAATNKDLAKEVENKTFRQDLLYRLKVVHLSIPPLRERKNDIYLLINNFLKRFSKDFGKNNLKFSNECIEYLMSYSWTGNVRELQNEIERLVVLSTKEVITPKDLSSEIRQSFFKESTPHTEKNSEKLIDMEKKHIQSVLHEVRGNQTEASKRLGISREGLRKKMNRWTI